VLKHLGRLVDGQTKYAKYTKGYNVTQIRNLYRENERINAEKKVRLTAHAPTLQTTTKNSCKLTIPKKRLAEAIGLQMLTTTVLRSDHDRDHHVGDNELELLACRLEARGGVPFSGDDLVEAFAGRESRSLGDLVGVVQELYVEKRRHRVRTREVLRLDGGSPRHLGTSVLLGGQRDDLAVA